MRRPQRTSPSRSSRNSRREQDEPQRGIRRTSRRATSPEEEEEQEEAPRTSRRRTSSRSSSKEEAPTPSPRRRSKPEEPAEPTSARSRAKKGWGAVDEHAKEVEAAQEASKNRVPDFYLKKDEESDVQFLSTEPYIFNAHGITTDDGNYKLIPCQLDGNIPGQDHPQTHCLACDANIKPSWRAGFLVLDHRGSWDKDIEDYAWSEPIVRKWAVGATVAQQIKKAFSKFSGEDISEVVFNVARSGSGAQDTTYNFQRALDGKSFVEPFPYEDYDYPLEEDAFAPFPDSYLEKVGVNMPSNKNSRKGRR